MEYFEILKELDRSIERECQALQKTSWAKRHVCVDRLKSALVHIKRELRKEV
jgi:hypothetical protein